jgi:hypothetical protein
MLPELLLELLPLPELLPDALPLEPLDELPPLELPDPPPDDELLPLLLPEPSSPWVACESPELSASESSATLDSESPVVLLSNDGPTSPVPTSG